MPATRGFRRSPPIFHRKTARSLNSAGRGNFPENLSGSLGSVRLTKMSLHAEREMLWRKTPRKFPNCVQVLVAIASRRGNPS